MPPVSIQCASTRRRRGLRAPTRARSISRRLGWRCAPADTLSVHCGHRGHRSGALAKWQSRTDHRPEGDTERVLSPGQSRSPTSELVELTISSSVSMEPRRLPWLPITQVGSQPSFKTLRRDASDDRSRHHRPRGSRRTRADGLGAGVRSYESQSADRLLLTDPF